MPRSRHATLIRNACLTDEGLMTFGNRVDNKGDVTFVRNAENPLVRDANHASVVTGGDLPAFEAILAAYEKHFPDSPHVCFRVSPLTTAHVTAALAFHDFAYDESVMLVLHREIEARPGACEIRRVNNDELWSTWESLHAAHWHDRARELPGVPHQELSAQFATIKRRRCPPARYWLAVVDDVPCAYLSSWEGMEGVGIVEDLFTLPGYRRRGIASALLVHGVADARAHGAGPVIIPSRARDTPKHMYAAMGWRPLYLARTYYKTRAKS